MSANSPCLRAHDLIDKLAMSPSTYKRRTAPQKVASSKEKAEPPKKAAMPPARREEPQQTTCEYSESCFTCPLKDCIQSDKACEKLNCL